MAGSIAHIKAPIAAEMELFERKFQEAMKSPVPLLDKITHFIVKRKGKQMRPMFVFFSANLCGGVTEKTYRAAALVELLHTATLVHDDVVDDAYERRGMFSLNALWKNKIAVLVGDYLLSKGLLLSIENDDFQLLKLVSTAVRRMSEGEMLQLEKARRLDITEEIYFEIIERKTASLLASCCACGAESAGAPPELIERLRQLGETIGIAFQIKDDLFDIGEEDTGKPRGTDIKERKMTLPLIHALSVAPTLQRRRIINLIKNHAERRSTVDLVTAFIHERGGTRYAEAAMLTHRDRALALLATFPASPSRSSLEELVRYTTDRKR